MYFAFDVGEMPPVAASSTACCMAAGVVWIELPSICAGATIVLDHRGQLKEAAIRTQKKKSDGLASG